MPPDLPETLRALEKSICRVLLLAADLQERNRAPMLRVELVDGASGVALDGACSAAIDAAADALPLVHDARNGRLQPTRLVVALRTLADASLALRLLVPPAGRAVGRRAAVQLMRCCELAAAAVAKAAVE